MYKYLYKDNDTKYKYKYNCNYLYIKMEAFINVIKTYHFVCIKINNMLDRYNRLTYDHRIEIVYENLIQNIILKELLNIMSIMISDLDIELKLKISRIKYLENNSYRL